MHTETSPLKARFLRLLTAAVILCTMYLISYALLGRTPESYYTPARNLNRILFSVLLAWPLVLLWQWSCYHRVEPAVKLWSAYAGGWLMLIFLSQFITLGFVFYPIFILCSLAVFLYATILLGAEIRSRRFDVTTLVATIVTLFSSGQVMVDAALNPIVI
ncbi:hypothetical protein Enr10x_60590 [Gimesia panareensis]|uniref:Uncharacterized protein n=1 Tax=Gimesia panareensis TaxID=2527978 RepID=A0A517QGD0_9PLAN|nr:hypothetical protein [Gimesia panareensis]QDT30691.1 hypothetical protein Enr10x_60590 [Gimesia panareensis]